MRMAKRNNEFGENIKGVYSSASPLRSCCCRTLSLNDSRSTRSIKLSFALSMADARIMEFSLTTGAKEKSFASAAAARLLASFS